MILAEAVRLSVQYVRRSPYVRERSQYVSRRQYGRGDSTSVGGSTAAEAVRQLEAVRPSGTVRQLDLFGAQLVLLPWMVTRLEGMPVFA